MELGIRIDLPPERVSACLQEVGIAFLFALPARSGRKHNLGLGWGYKDRHEGYKSPATRLTASLVVT